MICSFFSVKSVCDYKCNNDIFLRFVNGVFVFSSAWVLLHFAFSSNATIINIHIMNIVCIELFILSALVIHVVSMNVFSLKEVLCLYA